MIRWSPITLKFTLGIGALCSAGIIAELSQQAVSVWVALVLALPPLAIFVFADPSVIRHTTARLLQVAASLWYLVVNSVFLALFLIDGDLKPGWPVFVVGVVAGAIPCLLVLSRAVLPRAIAESGDPVDGQYGHSLAASAEEPAHVDTSCSIVYRPKTGKLLLLLLVSCLFVVGGVLAIADGQWFGWLGVVFFGAGIIVFSAQLISGRCYLRVSASGIEIHGLWRTTRYQWSDIARFFSGYVGSTRMVLFDFSPFYQKAKIARISNKAIAGCEGSLPATASRPRRWPSTSTSGRRRWVLRRNPTRPSGEWRGVLRAPGRLSGRHGCARSARFSRAR